MNYNKTNFPKCVIWFFPFEQQMISGLAACIATDVVKLLFSRPLAVMALWSWWCTECLTSYRWQMIFGHLPEDKMMNGLMRGCSPGFQLWMGFCDNSSHSVLSISFNYTWPDVMQLLWGVLKFAPYMRSSGFLGRKSVTLIHNNFLDREEFCNLPLWKVQ